MYGMVHTGTITITAGTSGEVKRITKGPGDRVKKGELLMRLDAADSAGELTGAKKRLVDATEQKKNAKAELDRTTGEVSYSRGRYLTFAYLLKRGAVATKEVERLKDEWEFAELQNKKAVIYYERAETELEEARVDLARTEAEYGSIFILSPADGFLTRVMTWEGGYLLKGDKAFAIAPAGEIYFTGRLDARQPISLGEEATILPLVVPTGTVKGYVAAIADANDDGSGWRVVTVRLFPRSRKDVVNIGKPAWGVVNTGR
jgi:multidrug resistance efflux pump